MATTKQGKAFSELHVQTHNTLSQVLESYHAEINKIDLEIKQLTQRKELMKLSAMAELSSLDALKVPGEAIGHLAAACW